jgi:hypothetical protein
VGPRAGLDVFEKYHGQGIRSPERPACSQSLYRLSYPAHQMKTLIDQNLDLIMGLICFIVGLNITVNIINAWICIKN